MLIVFIGFVSFKNILNLKSQLADFSKPNEIITSLQVIQKELTQIQSYIRAYTYSNDSKYLLKYEKTNANLQHNLESLLNKLASKPLYKYKYDSIRKYIAYKNKLITHYIKLQDVDHGQDELDSLMIQFNLLLQQAQLSDSTINSGSENESFLKNLISRIFTKNKIRNFNDSIVVVTDEHIVELKKTLQHSLYQNNQRELLKASIEMELLDQDIEIMDEIRMLISNLLEAENRQFEKEREANSDKIHSSLWLLGTIIGCSFILIIFFIIRILKNINKNEINREKLKEAKLKAEELSEAKARFMSNMSHEIRTPLTAILGFSEQLKTNIENKEEKEKYVNIITKSSEHLLNIVNEILTFSKIDAGKIIIEKEKFNYHDLIDEVYQVLAIKAREKKLEFTRYTDPALSNWFIGDVQKIKQIIINLTSNAIKFTPEGKVAIYSELLQKDGKNPMLKVQVKDTGLGIPENKLEEIFHEFTQNDGTSSRKFGGTGLGLTISRKMVEIMGGKIEVESVVNDGSVFYVYIPLLFAEKGIKQENKKNNEPVVGETISYSFSEKLNVLLVDDDEMNRELGKIILQNMGINPELACNGDEAVKKTMEKEFQVVLMDIHMPEKNGIEATQAIRKHERQNPNNLGTRIIALTANVLKEDVEKFMKAGMQGYLLKPFRQEELYKKIKETLDNYPLEEKGESLEDNYE